MVHSWNKRPKDVVREDVVREDIVRENNVKFCFFTKYARPRSTVKPVKVKQNKSKFRKFAKQARGKNTLYAYQSCCIVYVLQITIACLVTILIYELFKS